MEFTDAEVKELAGRRAKPVAAATRLKRAVPADPAGRLATDQAVPARVTRKELPSMRRAGRRPDKLIEPADAERRPGGTGRRAQGSATRRANQETSRSRRLSLQPCGYGTTMSRIRTVWVGVSGSSLWMLSESW